MSVSASIDLRVVHRYSGVLVSPIKIIEILLKHGWRVERNGYICYLPLGDKDNFAWSTYTMGIESLMKILQQKEAQNEIIGLVLNWQDTDMGGDLLLWTKEEMTEKSIHTSMSLCLTMNRKLLIDDGQLKITDVNWYVVNLLKIFNQGDTLVEYYTYEEHI